MRSSSGTSNHKTTFADWMLVAFLVIVSGYSFIFVGEVMPQGTDVKIEVDGKLAYVLPISVDRTVSVEGPYGKTIIDIAGGRVRVKESPCHNGLCMHQGWMRGGAIVCLPNRVLVIISGSGDKGLDGISG